MTLAARALLPLAMLLPLSLPGAPPAVPPPVRQAEDRGRMASGSAWRELLAGFQARGVAVVGSHPRCAEAALEGLYVRGRREVVVCPRGDRSVTLRHEGWHLVQSLCLADRPWLPAEPVLRQLDRRDRRELRALVAPSRWPREAEARVMARLAPGPYLQAVDQACAGRLPLGGGSGAAVPP
ncbi:MAG: hypothetical protein VKK62_11250 [Synechococcaceae cyanobacterium]|nr:hypothetical protein [Synechococcaceae cyanobacterium]